jgi:glutamine synthetase
VNIHPNYPGDPVDQDVYKFSKVKRKEQGIKELPTTLKNVLDAMEGD